jgi:hypothetical protein
LVILDTAIPEPALAYLDGSRCQFTMQASDHTAKNDFQTLPSFVFLRVLGV